MTSINSELMGRMLFKILTIAILSSVYYYLIKTKRKSMIREYKVENLVMDTSWHKVRKIITLNPSNRKFKLNYLKLMELNMDISWIDKFLMKKI